MNTSYLTLQSGQLFEGMSPEWVQGHFFGEVVFTTGMTGYFESLTDPSFAGQILVFTYPLMGNYGVPAPELWESEKIHAAGVVVNEACVQWSHSLGKWSLLDWLKEQRIPAIVGIDTRHLTKLLREKGVVLGAITTDPKTVAHFIDPNKAHLVDQVSVKAKAVQGTKGKKVIVVDCGMKTNILRSLKEFPVELHRVPHHYDYTKEEYDGVFISNGPGDPEVCQETIKHLKKALEKQKPIFGICLGAQLLALAAGAKTYKLRYGHRGHNQPCMDTDTGKCYITSQNHGYAIDHTTLPSEWKVTFKNLNDSTVEGIAHRKLPYFAVQFHPEAAPGPVDTAWLFEKFYATL